MRQIALAFQSHSPTSIAAARFYAPKAAGARARVFNALVATDDGMTDEELQDALRMNPSTQRPRRIELQRAGLIADSGRTRPTKSGAQAVVWVWTGAKYPERFPKA